MSTRLTPKQAAAIGVIIESNEGCAITLADNPSETRSVVVEVDDKPLAVVGGRGKVTAA
jgi:hypothetical protein